MPRWDSRMLVVGTAALGIISIAVVFANPNLSAHLAWFAPAVDVATFVLLIVVAAIGATDTWVRTDRRSLPLAAASLSIAILWISNVSSVQHNQRAAALSALAQLGTSTILFLAFYLTVGGPLRRPARAIRIGMSTAVLVGLALVGLVLLVANLLPSLSVAGHPTAFEQGIFAVALIPPIAGLYLYTKGARGDDRINGPMIGAWNLFMFELIASMGTHPRYSIGWYVLALLRLATFMLLTYGELRLYAISAHAERRRAAELELLHHSTTRIGASLNPADVASELADIVGAFVAVRTMTRPQVRVLQVDGSVVSLLTHEDDVGPGIGDAVADSFPLDSYPLLKSAIHSGQPRFSTAPLPTLVVPINSSETTFGAVEIRSTSPARTWQNSETVALMQGLAGVAALALTNAETFDDLQAAEAYNRAVLMAINDAFVSITLDGIIVGWNEHATDLLGWSRGNVLGRNIIDTVVPESMRNRARTALAVHEQNGGVINGRDPWEFEALRVDGTVVPVELNLWRVDSGSSSRLCILGRNISARKEAEQRLTRKATHDGLTELPNRELVMDMLGHALGGHNSRREHVGVIFVDVDRFKSFNDTHGHLAGDRLLASLAYRLMSAVRPDDVVGRIGGDEFLVVCQGLVSAQEVDTVAARLREAMAEPLPFGDAEVMLSASLGTAAARPGTVTARDLIRRADEAMYRDKARLVGSP